MGDIAEIVAVDWAKGPILTPAAQGLFEELQRTYDTVIQRTTGMIDVSEKRIPLALIVSGNAIADLSIGGVFNQAANLAYSVEGMGIQHPDLDNASQDVREILRFVCREMLGRYYKAMQELGYDAKEIAKDLSGVEDGTIRNIQELTKLSNKYDPLIQNLVGINLIKPQAGWASLKISSPPEAELRRLDFGYR